MSEDTIAYETERREPVDVHREPVEIHLEITGFVNVWLETSASPKALFDTREQADYEAERWKGNQTRIACVEVRGKGIVSG